MKKTMTINAKHPITALLGIITLIALVGFSANATAADKQTTDYGIVDWSTAAQGYDTFTAPLTKWTKTLCRNPLL